MKIACIATSKIPSNTANSIQVMKACSALAQLGHEVCLWVPGSVENHWEKLSAYYGLETPFEVRGVPAVQFLRRYDFALLAAFQARSWKADLVYTWLLQSGIQALRQRIPVVLELHDRPMGRFGPSLFRQFLDTAGKKRVLVITRALQKVLEKEYSAVFQPGEMVIAPNGVDLRSYNNLPSSKEARQHLGFLERSTVLFSGHLYDGRGAELMVQMAEQLGDVQFIWVGGRREDVDLWKTRLEQQEIKNITLTGFIENSRLPQYLAAGDILLMPYERKIAGSSGGDSADICSPMKMFEYLATGRAILSSDLPVIHEVLNENNAIFCPSNDVQSWVKAVRDLIDHPEKRKSLAREAKKVSENYSWNSRAEKALKDFLPRTEIE
jgi:glycosyltransferase involved in cell wall biosynthesis